MNFTIGKRKVGHDQPAFLIAEIGMNHNGDIELAKTMIKAAANSGADAVKFQSFKTEEFLSRDFFDFEERKKYELDKAAHKELKAYAQSCNVEFLSTPLDPSSLDVLNEIGVDAYKVASSDLNNLPFLKQIAEKKKPVIFSTGYADVSEIFQAREVLKEAGCTQIGIMHCIASYPTKDKNINLSNITMLRNYFHDAVIGFSDHSLDYELFPSAAVAQGARIIEKHFTTDQDLPGYDHAMSLTPEMFAIMTQNIRRVETALGKSRDVAGVYDCEFERKGKARRSLFWAKDGNKGDVIDSTFIIPKRPGEGFSPEYFNDFIGRELQEDVKEDSIVKLGQAK